MWGFAYDSAGRLREVTKDSAFSASYTYDDNGNRRFRTINGDEEEGTYDNQDRLVAYGDATYLHNAEGQRTHKIVGEDTTVYVYDALGALRSVILPTDDTIAYVIDPVGRRVGRKLNGTFTHRFLYQSDLQIAAELDSNNVVKTTYVYGTRVNVPEYMRRGDSTWRFITDHLGSVRLVVKESDGTTAQRIDYDEFGRVTFNSNPGFQPFGYAGGLYDDATALVRFGARDYDPALGRWTAKDPVGFAAGATNLFAYVRNSPVSETDVTGLCQERQKGEIRRWPEDPWERFFFGLDSAEFDGEVMRFVHGEPPFAGGAGSFTRSLANVIRKAGPRIGIRARDVEIALQRKGGFKAFSTYENGVVKIIGGVREGYREIFLYRDGTTIIKALDMATNRMIRVLRMRP